MEFQISVAFLVCAVWLYRRCRCHALRIHGRCSCDRSTGHARWGTTTQLTNCVCTGHARSGNATQLTNCICTGHTRWGNTTQLTNCIYTGTPGGGDATQLTSCIRSWVAAAAATAAIMCCCFAIFSRIVWPLHWGCNLEDCSGGCLYIERDGLQQDWLPMETSN